MKNGKTYLPKTEEIKRKWHFIDADGQVLGRLAVRVAALLRGKRKAIYTSHIDCGDFVVLTNVSKIVLTGKKLEQKLYRHHTGYAGNMKEVQYKDLMAKDSTKALELAVKGMMPKNNLGRKMLLKLHAYKDANYKEVAQKPEKLVLKELI